MNTKLHWENIYNTKLFNEVSWYEKTPENSLLLFNELKLKKDSKIIDVGCGESFFIDNILELGYKDITLLDISEKAIEKTKKRIGKNSNKIEWIIEDIRNFKSNIKYKIWHDRAVFHFLINEEDILNYINIANENIIKDGFLIIATFSDKGPQKCSGLNIKQYSEKLLEETFEKYFKKIKCINVNHTTPSSASQNFNYCLFKKNKIIFNEKI